jgi:dGTPase
MIFSGHDLETAEEKSLAPYACRSSHSRGRLHPEPAPEYRTEFQRDRDRILHNTSFRRLELKTQVFITYEGDYYRTRLTHTLEVAQIGRSIARALGANEDLVEAMCLAHDLGHPPFGHSGESTLARLMHDHGGFEHNRQSLRIVTLLERRYSEFPGLNLTWETREGIVKHETQYDVADAEGYEPELRGNLEVQITNVADEFAYTAHDLDDGLRSGILQESDMEGLWLWDRLKDAVGWTSGPLPELTRHRMIRDFIGMTIGDVVRETDQRITTAHIQSMDDIRQHSQPVVAYSEKLQEPLRALRERLFHRLYRHYRVMRMAVKAERLLTGLFQAFVASPEILPDTYQDRIGEDDLYRVVCDYLAGMTDRYALEEHQRLFDPQTRS